MTEREQILNQLNRLGITRDDSEELRRISMTLRRWYEGECGTERGGIVRDKPTEHQKMLNAIKIANLATAKNIPILAMLKVTTDVTGNTTVTGTDMDCEITVHTKTDLPAGSFLVNAKAVAAIKSDAAPVHRDNILVWGGRTIPTEFAEDFPIFPNLTNQPESTITLTWNDWRKSVDTVKHAISNDDTRFYLGGIHISANRRLEATDGHRVACVTFAHSIMGRHHPYIIPSETIAIISKIIGKKGDRPMTIRAVGQYAPTLVIDLGNGVIVKSKTIDGSFPNVDRVIPEAAPHHVTFSTSGLLAALDTVKQPDKRCAVKIEISNGDATLTTNDDDITATATVACRRNTVEPIIIGFNHEYLCDFLKVAGTNDVTFAIDDSCSPVRLYAKGRSELTYALMPIRV